MTNLTLVASFVLTMVLTALASMQSQQSDSLARFGSLRPDVRLQTEHGGWAFEYCPDNTCERFFCSLGNCDTKLIDFGFLYLSHVSEYVYLSEFQKNQAPPVTRNVLAGYKTACPQSSERDAVVCILRVLQRNHGIRISFVRYDEGKRNEVALNLEKELRRSILR